MPGLFAQHPLQGTLHHQPDATVTHECPKCDRAFTGNVRAVLDSYHAGARRLKRWWCERCATDAVIDKEYPKDTPQRKLLA